MNKITPRLRLVGYARVGTIGQTLEARFDQLETGGREVIFQEKASGAGDDRKELVKMLKKLGEGDLMVVTRTDRLARSIFQMFALSA